MMRVRNAHKNELEHLANLVREIHAERSQPMLFCGEDTQTALGFYLMHEDAAALLVAEVDGRLAGLSRLEVSPSWVNFQTRFLRCSVAVLPAYRRAGVGTALVKAAEQWANTHRCDGVFVCSEVADGAPQKMLERLDYSLQEVSMFKKVR